MSVNWQSVLLRLRSYPSDVHNIRPPCSEERIVFIEQQLGRLPDPLREMLGHLNGAKLFIAGSGGELLSVFGVSEVPPLPPLEWAPEWYIDKFTPQWRAAGKRREADWPIGMMNYGGLIIFNAKGTIREWDTSQAQWSTETFAFDEWIAYILREGDAYLKECE